MITYYNLEEIGWISIDTVIRDQCYSELQDLAKECVVSDLDNANQTCRKVGGGLRKKDESCSLKNGNITIYYEDACEFGLVCVETNGEGFVMKL